MSGFDTIMAALAFSPYTEGILSYTGALARKLDANLVVCSVIDRRDVNAINRIVQLGYEVDSDHYVHGVEAERRQILDQLIEKRGFDRERIRTVFKIGNPVHEIIQAARDHEVGMIVMGTKANTDLEHMIVGSVAERLFRRSPITIVSYRDPSVAERLHSRTAA